MGGSFMKKIVNENNKNTYRWDLVDEDSEEGELEVYEEEDDYDLPAMMKQRSSDFQEMEILDTDDQGIEHEMQQDQARRALGRTNNDQQLHHGEPKLPFFDDVNQEDEYDEDNNESEPQNRRSADDEIKPIYEDIEAENEDSDVSSVKKMSFEEGELGGNQSKNFNVEIRQDNAVSQSMHIQSSRASPGKLEDFSLLASKIESKMKTLMSGSALNANLRNQVGMSMELKKPAQFIEVYEEDHNPLVMVEANSDQDYGDEYDDQKSPSIKNFNEDGEMGDSQEYQERLKIDVSDSNSQSQPMFKKQRVQLDISSGQDHSR